VKGLAIFKAAMGWDDAIVPELNRWIVVVGLGVCPWLAVGVL